MRNAHDVGGILSYGAVPREPAPKHDYEGLAFGLTLAAIANGFLRNVDENRYAKERMAPGALQDSTYFELWLAALEMNLVEHGVLALGDIEDRAAQLRDGAARPTGYAEDPALTVNIEGMLRRSAHQPPPHDQSAPRFATGDLVRTRVLNSRRHTRLPIYAAGRLGHIDAVLPPHRTPDVSAHEDTEVHDWVYRVRFAARELWGPDASPRDTVTIDLWESYLEPKDDQ